MNNEAIVNNINSVVQGKARKVRLFSKANQYAEIQTGIIHLIEISADPKFLGDKRNYIYSAITQLLNHLSPTYVNWNDKSNALLNAAKLFKDLLFFIQETGAYYSDKNNQIEAHFIDSTVVSAEFRISQCDKIPELYKHIYGKDLPFDLTFPSEHDAVKAKLNNGTATPKDIKNLASWQKLMVVRASSYASCKEESDKVDALLRELIPQEALPGTSTKLIDEVDHVAPVGSSAGDVSGVRTAKSRENQATISTDIWK